MSEFTWRAVLLGLVLCVVLGAANAYLGLKAGQTIAATYPAAVIGMAVLRVFKGSILEENIARTAGSIGESVAAGAVFTLPAFVMVKAWGSFDSAEAYWKSTALMLVGSVLGVLFVSLIRRVMVEDPELPFPESVAASEVHKAGQGTAKTAKYLFYNIGFGAAVFLAGAFGCYAPDQDYFFHIGQLGTSALRLGPLGSTQYDGHRRRHHGGRAQRQPGLHRRGLHHRTGTGGAQFLRQRDRLGPADSALHLFPRTADSGLPAGGSARTKTGSASPPPSGAYIVRPIAVGSMMVGTCYTLFRMRKNLIAGLAKAVQELKAGAVDQKTVGRTERYMSSKTVFGLIGVTFLLMCVLYIYMTGIIGGAIAAALVMLIVGFFFATVSGYLVGVIGSSNNPISGLTLSTLVIAALLMVSLGVSGTSGVVAVLAVAAVVCVSSAVAGELLQDFKVGYILGGTPRTIQITELIAVVVASCVMYFPLLWLHVGNINKGGIGFGDKDLSAPQAGLMASLAQGIVGGDMAWPLVITGILMGIAMIMFKVRSPMLVAIGMYLPIGTTSAIFIGGMIRWVTDTIRKRRAYNEAQTARVENVGVLVASGLIAGEALSGLVIGWFNYQYGKLPSVLEHPSYLVGVVMMALLALALIRIPLANAGDPNEPAPPSAMM